MSQVEHGVSADAFGEHYLYRVRPATDKISEISAALQSEVFGQQAVCDALARAVVPSRVGLSDPERPLGSFLFLGPTGTGKTELAKTLARFLYGKEWRKRLVLINCTELTERHEAARLKGAPNSYIGYGDPTLITPEMIEDGAVVVFDEVEKAHRSVHRWLLPVLEEGRTTVQVPTSEDSPAGGKAKKIAPVDLDFRKSFVIMTSNVGSESMQKARRGVSHLGFSTRSTSENVHETGLRELKQRFMDIPEFLGRLTPICFDELTPGVYGLIFDKFVGDVNGRIGKDRNPIVVTTELREELIARAVRSGEYGARDLRNVIEQVLVSKVSEIIFSGAVPKGVPLIGVLENGEVEFLSPEVVPLDEQVELESLESSSEGTGNSTVNTRKRALRKAQNNFLVATQVLAIGIGTYIVLSELARTKGSSLR